MESQIAVMRDEFAAFETETETLIGQARTSESLLLKTRRAMALSRAEEPQ